MGIFLTILFSLSLLFAEPPEVITTPSIDGEVLFIEGPIDSHIYDFLAYQAKALKKVKTVRFNSYGGSHYWGLAVAEKIQINGWNTLIGEGDVCASACVYMFGHGKNRIAHASIWFGIHGARLGKGHMVEFASKCLSGDQLIESDECQALEEKNYLLNLENTEEAFTKIEEAGVSNTLFETYMSFEDDPRWYLRFNFLKKPDWVLPAKEALEFNLVTDLI